MRGPTHLRYANAPPIGAAKPELQRPWNDRRFPPLGVKQMPSDGCLPFRRGEDIQGGHNPETHNASFSEGGAPSPVWFGTFAKRRTGRGATPIFPPALRNSDARLCLARPPLARRNGAPHESGAGGESAPTLLAAGAAWGSAKGDRGWDTLCPPCGEVALTTVIPAGRIKFGRPGPGWSCLSWL